jgi:hypothetical protein
MMCDFIRLLLAILLVTVVGGCSDSADTDDVIFARQGESCDLQPCADGYACVAYYGIAGPRGSEIKSCEIQCTMTADCPGGQRCLTIADGPGQVCRASSLISGKSKDPLLH